MDRLAVAVLRRALRPVYLDNGLSLIHRSLSGLGALEGRLVKHPCLRHSDVVRSQMFSFKPYTVFSEEFRGRHS